MSSSSDGELLRRYVEDGSEAAFTELVQRHINLVYLAALRRVGRNAHAADDVTQKVFTSLARKAPSLAGRPSIIGWLYTSTRFAAADVVRAEQRRRTHEQEAQTMNELNSDVPVAVEQLEPLLDEVIELLPERDREAVLLHFFEGRPFSEVGAALSLSADAARMRVNRALERLRSALARRGITSSAAALAGALSVQSTFAAPAPLAMAVAGHAILNSGTLGAGVSVVAKFFVVARSVRFLAWTGATLAIVVGGLAVRSISGEKEKTGAVVSAEPTQGVAGRTAEPLLPEVKPAEAEKNDALAPTSAPALSAAAAYPTPTRDFGSLSQVEKNVLARLWHLHLTAHPPAGARVGLKPAPAAPNFEQIEVGCEQLVESGWVAIGPRVGLFYLTKTGLAYCEAHRGELETQPVFEKVPGVPR